jgi:hypothetical protein
MVDLLVFKRQELAKDGALSDQLEETRPYLLDFYRDYKNKRENKYLFIDHIKNIVVACDLPVPYDLLNLFEQAENACNPQEVYDEKQRDHLLHSLNLFCFGALLITRFNCVADRFGDCGLDETLRRWAFCALLHDIGYFEINKKELKEPLMTRFKSIVQEVFFQVICVFGYKSPWTRDLDRHRINERHDLREVTAPARQLIDRTLGESPTPSSPGAIVVQRALSYYFSKHHSDHGISSSIILSFCKNIAEAICTHKENFDKHNLTSPIRDLWTGLENPLNAIAFHDEKKNAINSDVTLFNPWISFLYIMDNLTEYDRPGLRPDSRRRVLPIEDVELEVIKGQPTLHYPSTCTDITDSDVFQRTAGTFGLHITSEKENDREGSC